jgi:glycosyltransferase involved in cell wall biosynthesis
MLIAFIHAGSSFLPEIQAYQAFLNQWNINTISVDSKEAKKIRADVMWCIMGFMLAGRKDMITIHEYTSASAPPYAAMKNFLKTKLNAKPDFRLFLNEYVQQQLHFNDKVPSGFRDMGVDLSIFRPLPITQKIYDFIYVGNLHHTRGVSQLLQCFSTGALCDRSLLVLGRDYKKLAGAYAAYSNIHFAGPVQPPEVAAYINQSKFAVNYIPDIAPYNSQTSTKLLEYAACCVPIVTTSYRWIKSFQLKYGGRYFFLQQDLSNFHWETVNNFDYAFPDLTPWQWEKQITNSGIMDFLKTKFPETFT